MGLFDGFMKVLQGKPVFEDSAVRKNDPYQAARGGKLYPELIVERSACKLNGSTMQVYATIKNVSPVPLVLDRLRFLGSDKQMPSDLSVGESMQYLVYDGPRPPINANPNFEITYYDTSRDYFSALYFADFRPEPDGTASVKQFRRQRSIKDI